MKYFTITFLTYLLLISFTMWCSAYLGQKTLYDRYIISLEGLFLEVRDLEQARLFYEDVMDFSGIIKKGRVLGFKIPGNRALYLRSLPKEQSAQAANSVIVIKVRNGLSKLYSHIRSRLEDSALKQISSIQLADISQKPWGSEFSIRDPDGNKLIFYKPQGRLSLRSAMGGS